jgi:two-component system cell cycle sensor histidine kinase/response regulator CckA
VTSNEYQALFEALPDPAFLLDHETGQILDVNPRLVSVYGYDSREEMIGKSSLDVSAEPEKTAKLLRAGVSDALHLCIHRRKDGSLFPAEISMSFIALGGRRIALGVVRDASEARRSAEALRTSEEKFAKTFKSSPIAMTVSQMSDGTYLDVNDMFTALTGISREEALGEASVALGIWDNDEDRARLADDLRSGRAVVGRECRFRSRTRGVLTCLFSAQSIQLGGEPCILGSINDITDRVRAEEQRAKLEAQLRQAQKVESLGRLAGGVAHDLNNMLSVIFGHTDLAIGQVDPAHRLREDLEEIRKAAQRSADLTRQLLAFARRQTIAPKVLDLNATLSGTLTMLRRLVGEDIAVEWLPDPALWPVEADRSQIDQILVNLCVNARDAIAGVGTLTLRTANVTIDASAEGARDESLPGDYATLAVTDDGCGLDEETRAQMFEPFFTTKPLGQGTGLGLATVYGIVKQNGGFIDVDTAPGRGTTFTIHLPRHDGKAASPGAPAAAPVTRGSETILLVEDEPAILKVTTMVLEGLGYTVVAAHGAREALRLASAHVGRVHLLLTDVVMPEMNGKDLARRLVSLHPEVKLLFMSGYTSDVIARRGVLEEGVNFLQKPFSQETLGMKLREILDRVSPA